MSVREPESLTVRRRYSPAVASGVRSTAVRSANSRRAFAEKSLAGTVCSAASRRANVFAATDQVVRHSWYRTRTGPISWTPHLRSASARFVGRWSNRSNCGKRTGLSQFRSYHLRTCSIGCACGRPRQRSGSFEAPLEGGLLRSSTLGTSARTRSHEQRDGMPSARCARLRKSSMRLFLGQSFLVLGDERSRYRDRQRRQHPANEDLVAAGKPARLVERRRGSRRDRWKLQVCRYRLHVSG